MHILFSRNTIDNLMKIKILYSSYFLCAVLFVFPIASANASIVFKDGYWSTSFDCSDWVHDYPASLSCDGIDAALNNCAGNGVVPCSGTDQSRGESVLASANHDAGVKNTGAQVHYFYTGQDGKGSTNDVSGGLQIRFPYKLQEYWLRAYIYYPEDMGWGGPYSGWKTFYFDHDSTAGWYFGFPRNPNSSGFYFQTTSRSLESNGYGDEWLESNNRQGFGRWIPLEIHFRNDTNGSDGIVQVWVDDQIIINVKNHDFGVNGFSEVLVGSNGDSAVGTPNKAVDIRFDDFMIATPEYRNFVNDGNGNPRIGLIAGGTTPSPSPTPSPTPTPDPEELNPAKTILFETWEDNSTKRWQYDYIAGESSIDTSPTYGSSYAFKHQALNTGKYAHFFGDHPLLQNSSDMVTDITIEEYYRPSAGFDWVTGLKLWVVNAFENWGAGYGTAAGQAKPHSWAPFYMSILVDANGAPYGQLSRADGLGGAGTLWKNYWQNSGNAVLSINEWNKIKFRLKLNTPGQSDGIFQLWINDALQCDYSDVNFRGTYTQYGWNHLMISMHSVPEPSQNQWVARDNITILSGIVPENDDVLQPPSGFLVIKK